MKRKVIHRLLEKGQIAILCAAIAAPANAQSAQDDIPAEGVIRLYQSDNRVLVMMQIGDGELTPMVFDTGSDGNSVDQLLVNRNDLKRIGDMIEVDGTTLKERVLPFVEVQDVTLGGLPVGTIQAGALNYDRTDAMGIISSEIFTRSLVYLELDKNRVRLEPRDTARPPEGPATPYYRGIATINIVMPDGSELPAHFDTGYNAALSLPISLMDKLPLTAPPRVIGRFKSINTEGDVYGGRVQGCVQIGPIKLDNPEVSFLGDLANIGLPVIRRVTLVLDPENKHNWTLETEDAQSSSVAPAQGEPTVGRCAREP